MAVDPEKVYHGKPCKKCGATLRWKSSRGCVACERERIRRRGQNPEWRERQRQYLRQRRRKYKARSSCVHCGSELDPASITRCPAHLKAGRDSDRRYWHAPNGGYVQYLRRKHAQEREQILTQLAELNQMKEELLDDRA